MDIRGVVAAFQRGSPLIPRAVKVLFNYSHPLTEREVALLNQYVKGVQEQQEAGLRTTEVPENINALAARPLQRLPAVSVIQCVLGAAKIPSFPIRYQRQLQRQLLPLVVRDTPLTREEWTSILHQTATLPMGYSRTALRCAEEILKVAAPPLFKGDAVPQAGEEQTLFLNIFATVVLHYAKLHAACRKHSFSSLSLNIPVGNENVLLCGPMRRLRRILEKSCNHLREKWGALIEKLPPPQALTLSVFPSWSYPISKETVQQTVKSSPMLMLHLLGKKPVPGSLLVDKAEEVIQLCLYNMGLTNCSLNSTRDYLTVILALPVSDKRGYFMTHGEDSFFQLLMPFVNKGKILTPEVAQEWETLYCLIFLGIGMEEELLPLFVRAAAAVMQKCCASTEKASIMILTSAVLRASSETSRLRVRQEDIVKIIERDLVSHSADAVKAAWRLLQVSGVENRVVDEMRAALKSAKGNEEVRWAMALYISPKRAPSDVIEGLNELLFDSCEEVDAYRPAAFIALRSLVESKAKVSPKLCTVLCRADVVSRIGESRDELDALAETAVALANVFFFSPMALLLTHRSGLLRRRLSDSVEDLASDASAAIALWDSVTHVVFGLEEKEKTNILSNSACGALLPVASALLKHTAKMAVPTALRELVICCGHDHIQGEDPYYFCDNDSLLGRMRTSSKVVQRRLFDSLFSGEHRHLLVLHHDALVDGLCGYFSESVHLRTAASRGLVLLLGTRTGFASSQIIFNKLLDAVKESVEYMLALDMRYRAIAAASPAAMLQYEEKTLRERQLLKTYPSKPPKGMAEDDFEDMKRRDAAALEKGREELRKEIQKHSRVIEDVLLQRKTALVTVRTLGTSGDFPLECVAVLFPYLQETLSGNDVPEVLERLLVDAIAGLLSRTAFAHIAEGMSRTVAELEGKASLSVDDVSRVSTMATYLRQSMTKMLPPPLFVVLLPFSHVAFKAGRGSQAVRTTIPLATQHQIMGVLIQNIGQANLPQPTETLQLLYTILQRFPSLFKSVQQGINLLMAMIPTSHLVALELGFFNQVDTVKEVTAAAYHRFSHFSTCRRALTLAAVFLHDSSTDVVRSMRGITQNSSHPFTLCPTDWNDLTYFLQAYGQQQKHHATRISASMRELFLLPNTTDVQQRSWLKDICKIGGLGSVVAIEVLSSSLKGDAFQDVLLYLCTIVESPNTEPFMLVVLSCGRVVLHDCSLVVLKAMSQTLQVRLSKPPKDITPVHKELYLAISTVWLTIIGCRLKENSLLESIIVQQGSTLNNSTSAMVHRTVCDSMVEVTKNKDACSLPQLDEFVQKCLKQVLHSGSYIKKKAHAYGVAGVLHGLGLTSLRRYNILETMQASMREKQAERSGVMVLLEVLSEVMGPKFEPYALAMSSGLLEGVADKDQKVSECADDASRLMVSSLTAVGLRQLIPRLVKGLAADQAKMRIPPLNFIGYVAFCSPKQLAATLPEITKHINACLFDVNHNVSAAAMNALRRVAGVVSNTEIREHVEVILAALRSPNTETENALDTLLYTRFVNAVDPASLALIIPIISRGLSNQMPHTRPKAAQIVASMVNLVNDTQSLKPYCQQLVSLLEEAAEDPKTETRTTSAKAIAALAAAIGGTLVDEIVAWCFSNLHKSHGSSVEKAGAAQVFVEIVESCGDAVLYDSFAVIETGMLDERPPVREGFLHIVVYAPSTLNPTTFQQLLPMAFPWVLEGLSHFSDRVRDVALTAGSSIINLYGTRNLALVLEPLMNGVLSEVSTLRHSSLLLTSKLLLHIVQNIRKKMRVQSVKERGPEDGEKGGKEDEQTNGEPAADDDTGAMEILQVESARSVEKRGISVLGALEEALGTEGFVRLLSAIFCGRNEHNLNVRTESNNAWQACVASPCGAVKKIFSGLIDLLIIYAPSENPDCAEMASKTIEFTSRLSEMIEPFIDTLCDRYKEDDRRSKLGALTCLTCVVGYVDGRRLIGMGGQIVGCVLPGMQEKDPRVQQCARELFAKVSKIVGPGLIESATEAQLETSVRGVVEVVKVKPNVALEIIFRYLNRQSKYVQHNLELLDTILDVEEADDQMRRYIPDMGKILLAFLVQRLDGASESYQKFIAGLSQGYEHIPQEQWQKALRAPATQLGALAAAEAFGLGISTESVESLSAVFRAAIESLGSDSDEMRALAVSMIPKLFNSIERRIVDSLEEEEQQDLTTSKRAVGRYLLQYLGVFQETLGVTARAMVTDTEPEFSVLGEGGQARLFDSLMAFYNRGLDYGTSMQKVQAVECIQDLLTYAPRRVSAGSTNTVAGRCSKVLFVRNDGGVVLAVVRLCLQLMGYPASGKEAMVEGTMALAMFNAALCDVGEARVLALRVVIQLLQRSERYADLILGTVVAKKAAVDSPLLRGVMCRFISVVVRYSNLSKTLSHITKLMDIVKPIWERAETPATAVAAGVAVAALCRSASITDEQFSTLKDTALNMMSTKGTSALGGFAFSYSVIASRVERVDASFVNAAMFTVRSAAGFGISDKLSVTWILRATAALVGTGLVPTSELKMEVYAPLLRRVDANDEVLMSTSQYFYDAVSAQFPQTIPSMSDFHREMSTQWCVVGHFDADLDDEVIADTMC
ncbi:hypothetical protein DPX39_100138900 [Trypanosoma brucei equiperdum]|uniref:TOG domain-containing protein n=1 Tax=Trypanosoma brucei equiperdum TaxID=630700 RepID=A0A3L6KXJ5_9TRYP|nr:hypothetical protein DPX39_100138900 [Trypanosoma brucei equiperdum]